MRSYWKKITAVAVVKKHAVVSRLRLFDPSLIGTMESITENKFIQSEILDRIDDLNFFFCRTWKSIFWLKSTEMGANALQLSRFQLKADYFGTSVFGTSVIIKHFGRDGRKKSFSALVSWSHDTLRHFLCKCLQQPFAKTNQKALSIQLWI